MSAKLRTSIDMGDVKNNGGFAAIDKSCRIGTGFSLAAESGITPFFPRLN